MAEESAEDLMATKLKGELRSALRIAEDIQALKAKMSMLMEVVREDKEREFLTLCMLLLYYYFFLSVSLR